MIHQALHKNPVALDRIQHRLLRLRRDQPFVSRMAPLNSFLVVVGEFVEAAREYPLVWIPAGTDAVGNKQVAPVAVFGLAAEENLYLEPGGWRTPYMPLLLRMYPFAMARAAEDSLVMCYDASWPGFSITEGEPLFEVDGTPTAFTLDMQRQLEQLEIEVERTRLFGEKLLQKNLLQEMRFEATLPGGEAMSINGFLTIDDQRFAELSDADVLDFHRSGLLAMVHAHRVSLGHMTRLVGWRAQRETAKG